MNRWFFFVMVRDTKNTIQDKKKTLESCFFMFVRNAPKSCHLALRLVPPNLSQHESRDRRQQLVGGEAPWVPLSPPSEGARPSLL